MTHGGWKIVGMVESSILETPLASKNVMKEAASAFFSERVHVLESSPRL